MLCHACREAEFLLKLSHPSIVECFDVVDNGKQMVLVMEYLRGGPLLDDLHHIAGESYTEQQAAAIAAQVCLACMTDCVIATSPLDHTLTIIARCTSTR